LNEFAQKMYNLNRLRLEVRNSRQYFIGDRIEKYVQLIKCRHFLAAMKLFGNDSWRVLVKKKRVPEVQILNLSESYSGERIAVYTSVYGNYDEVSEPLYNDPMCDYYIFTNLEIPKTSIWQKVDFNEFPNEVDTDFLKNRYVKIMSHVIFPRYKYTVYVDGNIQIVSEISLYFKNFHSKTGIGMHQHPSNNDLYDEIKTNQKLSKITLEESKSIKKTYKKHNMPRNFGMFECNVIFRDQYNSNCTEIMNQWWRSVYLGIKRDQLYFTFILFKLGYSFNDMYLIGNTVNTNPMFIRNRHK